jgi:UDP-N-acetylmuramoyl-L-alanyl-D-glutamate--2,6-diaminopimelate ligase
MNNVVPEPIPFHELLTGVCPCPPALGRGFASGVSADSRHMKAGGVFVGIPGIKQNGALFVTDAVQRGAALVILQDGAQLDDATKTSGTEILFVRDARAALSRLAANFFRHPARSLAVFAVTGTNGKTTSCWLMQQALSALGRKVLRLGTAGNFLSGVFDEQSELTTLDPLALHRYFATAVGHGAGFAALEASSHALHQKRLADVPLSVALFTNLTQDHLDYHGSMEAYEGAKRGIFDLLKGDGTAVINIDDPCGVRFLEYCQSKRLRCLTFGRDGSADYQLKSFRSDAANGTAVELSHAGALTKLETPLIGEFNAENAVGVFVSLKALGFSAAEALRGLERASGAPGRLERVTPSNSERAVFVDYAHTPDALERTLKTLRTVCRGKLWVVFGCGGDRDRSKRPIMGGIASKFADRVIVTSDNPRTEDPQGIISEIIGGVSGNAEVYVDRAEAINCGVSTLNAGDVLLVAGKGHEDYQIFSDRTVPFSDQQVARAAFQRSFA